MDDIRNIFTRRADQLDEFTEAAVGDQIIVARGGVAGRTSASALISAINASVSEIIAPVLAALDEPITVATQAALDRKANIFMSRGAFAASLGISEGTPFFVFHAGYLLPYIAKAAGTCLTPNLTGMNGVPAGNPTAEHYGALRDGINNDGPSINLCLNTHGLCFSYAGTYLTKESIGRLTGSFTWYAAGGENTNAASTYIVGTADIPVDEPIIMPGRSSCIVGFFIGYEAAAITGAETEGQRRGLGPKEDSASPQRGSYYNYLVFNNVGTAIGDVGYTPSFFSTSLGAIEIRNYTFAAIDLDAGTGCVWENIYASANNFTISGVNVYPTYGLRCADGNNGAWGQINIEHTLFKEYAIKMSQVRGINFTTLHIEGCGHTQAGKAFIRMDSTAASFSSLTFIHEQMLYDNVALIELGDGRPWTSDNPDSLPFRTEQSTLFIRKLQTRGLANPHAGDHPTYPSGRRGLANVSGFKFFRRASGYTDRRWRVVVEDYQAASYAGYLEDAQLRYPDTRYSDTTYIEFAQFGRRGTQMRPGKNFLPNGAMSAWTSTSVTQSSSGRAQCATNWYINRGGTGAVKADQVACDLGDDTEYWLKFSNAGANGSYQSLEVDVTDLRALSPVSGGATIPCVLSFWGKAEAAGRALEQIRFTLTNAAGSPTTSGYQVIAGSNSRLDFATTPQFFSIPFEIPADIVTLGAGAYRRLAFQINDATAARESTIYLKKVKIELGYDASNFSVAA